MRWIGAVGLGLLTAGFTGCAVDREVEPVVIGLRDRLTPDGGSVFAFSGLRRDRSGVHATWEINTAMAWSAYSDWVKSRMPPDFRLAAAEPASLLFRKTMDADSFQLRLEPIVSASPPRVRATFDGYPN